MRTLGSFRHLVIIVIAALSALTVSAQPTITGNTRLRLLEGDNSWIGTVNQVLAGRVGPDSSFIKNSGSYLIKRYTDKIYRLGNTGLGTQALDSARLTLSVGPDSISRMPLLITNSYTGWYMHPGTIDSDADPFGLSLGGSANTDGTGTRNNVYRIGVNRKGAAQYWSNNKNYFGDEWETDWASTNDPGHHVYERHIGAYNDSSGVSYRPFTMQLYRDGSHSDIGTNTDVVNFRGREGQSKAAYMSRVIIGGAGASLFEAPFNSVNDTLGQLNLADIEWNAAIVAASKNGGGISGGEATAIVIKGNESFPAAAAILGRYNGTNQGNGLDLVFTTQHNASDGGQLARMYIQAGQAATEVGIGVSNPLQTLDVNGTALVRGSARFNGTGDSTVVNIKGGAATAKLIDLANSAVTGIGAFASNATPESAITANPGSVAFTNIFSAGSAWIKRSGTGNTGWGEVATTAYPVKTYVETRTMPTTVGNTVKIGYINWSNQGSAGYLEVLVNTFGGDNDGTKAYMIARKYNSTGGAWMIVPSISTYGQYSSTMDFVLEMKSVNHVDSLRLRRTVGTSASTATVTLEFKSMHASTVLVAETSTDNPTSVTTYYTYGTINSAGDVFSLGGAVNASTKLSIMGTGATFGTEAFRASNSSGTRQLTIRNDGRTSVGNEGSPARTLHIAGEMRVTDLTTDPPTEIIGADADGDFGILARSAELTIASGTLKLAQQGATNGQVLEWNGSAWAPAADDSGAGSSYYQTMRDDGTGQTQRGKLNFVSTSTVATTLTDDSGSDETEVALSIPADGVTSTEIAPNAVGQSEISTDGVGELEIEAAAVGSSEVADNSLLAADLAVNVVSSIDGVVNDGGDVDFVAGTNITVTPSDGSDNITFEALAKNQTTSQFTGDQDNLNPTNWSSRTTHRLSGDGTIRAITGFVDLPDGTIRRIVNAGSNALYLPASHPDSDVGHRIAGRSDQFIAPGGVIEMYYSGPDSMWVVTSNTFTPSNMPDAGVTGHYYNVSVGATTGADWGTLGFGIASGGNSTTIATSTLPAGWDINTASSASGAASLYLSKTVGNPVEMGSAHIVTSLPVHFPTLSDGTNTYTFSFGLIPTPSSTTLAVNNSIGIRYTNGTNSGKWQGFSRDNAGAESTVDLGTTVAANTKYLLTICFNKARDEARFYLNGVYAGRVTGNMPGTNDVGSRAIIVKSAGTTSRSAVIPTYTFYTIY